MFFDAFAKWFRHDLDNFDFVWNILLICVTDGLWFWGMLLYYWFKHYRNREDNSNGNEQWIKRSIF